MSEAEGREVSEHEMTATEYELRQLEQAAVMLAAVAELMGAADAATPPADGYAANLARTSAALEDVVRRAQPLHASGPGMFRAGVNEHAAQLHQRLIPRPR